MIRRLFLVVGVLLAAFATLVVIVLVYAWTRPDEYAVERSAVIATGAERAFSLVDDLAHWETWSPWEHLDPNAKITFSNPSAGKGAVFTWDGNDQIGMGTLTILASEPPKRVELEQAFVRPFAGKATMIFTFAPEAAGIKVTWRIEGKNDFAGKCVCVFCDMDQLLGGKFEEGLERMKSALEAGPGLQVAPSPASGAPGSAS